MHLLLPCKSGFGLTQGKKKMKRNVKKALVIPYRPVKLFFQKSRLPWSKTGLEGNRVRINALAYALLTRKSPGVLYALKKTEFRSVRRREDCSTDSWIPLRPYASAFIRS